MDICTTFARLAGCAPPRDRVIDGLDQSGLFLGRSERSARDTLLYYTFRGAGLSSPVLAAIRHGRWKYFLAEKTPDGKTLTVRPTLYDLQQDLGETTDVYTRHPELVERFQLMVADARHDIGEGEQLGVNCRVTPEDLETQKRVEAAQKAWQIEANRRKQ